MIELGQKVKCKVTGFTGIATAKIEFLNGCIQFCVKPKIKAKDNKMPEGQYIDVEQLEVVGEGTRVKKKGNGGVMSDLPNADYRG